MKNYLLQVSALFICLFAFPADAYPEIAQIVYYVNIHNGNDSNDGLSWSSAFKNLQTAIDAATGGDTIKVAAGTYLPTEKMAVVYNEEANTVLETNDRHRSFLIKKEIHLYGGFPTDATDATTVGDRDWIMNETILSGDFNGDDGDGFENTEENALHVVVMLNLTTATRLDGFVITGGNAAGDSADVKIDNNDIFRDCGGGVCAISYYTSSPVLANMVIRDNQAKSSGGGFFNLGYKGNASPALTNVTMTGNYANESGGAICIDGMFAEPVLNRVNLTGNFANDFGGGFFCYAEKTVAPVLSNTLIGGNKARIGGGAFIISVTDNASPAINNTTVCGNMASGTPSFPEGGGGIFISSQVRLAMPLIRNSVFWGNRCNNLMNNLIIEGGGANSVIAVYAYSLVEGTALEGTNLNGDVDPMFVNPLDAGLAPTLSEPGDYRLLPESPLIDKGQNFYAALPDDLDGNPRIIGDNVDIGAYECQDDISGNEVLAAGKVVWSHQGVLFVKISRKTTTVHIFSINGTLVRQINNLTEGMYTISSLPRDVYIVSLSTGETAKIVIR